MIRALLLDATGTLIEPAEPVAETYSRLLAAHGHHLDPPQLRHRFAAAFRDVDEPSYHEHENGHEAERFMWRKIVEATVADSVSNEAFSELFNHYADPAAWRLLPEVPEFLERTSAAKLRLCVVSNFDLRLHPILDGLHLTPWIQKTVTSAEARSRKPSPEIFHQTLAHLGLEADQVIHIGDSEQADLAGARSAGIDGFLIERPKTDLLSADLWARLSRTE